MKIGPSTIGAVVFTAVSVAAFGWMTQRPKASGEAVGFAMPSSGSVSSSAGSTSANTPQAEADLSNSSVTESATAEKTTEKVENTSTANDSDTSASTDAEAPTSGSEASTKVVAETEKTTESSNATNTAGATAAVVANSAGSEETSVTESTAQSFEAPSSSNQANSTATVSSTEPQSSEKTAAPEAQAEQAAPSESTVAPEAQTEQSASSEPTAQSSEATTANTSPSIQAIQLKSANGTSAGIYTAAANANGTVVILHGCDYKPEGEDNIVRPLHEGLPQEGWNTLSLQLPNLSASSSYKDLEAIMPDAAVRIESGIAMAKEKSQTPVVLFAHGCGAQVALAWMEVKGSDSINGYIGLGAGVMNASADDASHLRLPLEKMKFPQLDIYGSGDNESVLKTAPERLSHINRAANPASRQKKIEGADHNITGKGKELSDVVVKWLNGLAFKK